MKIALVNPPNQREKVFEKTLLPIGLLYITSYLKSQGINVDTFDFSLSRSSFGSLIQRHKLGCYDLISFSTFTITFMETIELIKMIKAVSSKPKILVGGHHASLAAEKILEDFACIDYVIIRYGEIPMYNLIKALVKKEDLNQVGSLIYRKNGKIIKNPPETLYRDLDILPFPEKEIVVEYNDQVSEEWKICNVVTSRGCPYNCYYCVNTNNSKWIARSPKNVITEIKHMYNKQHFDHIFFTDCNFMIDPERSLQIAFLIHEFNDRLTMNFHIRADQVLEHKAVLKKMVQLGCKYVNIGIESNSKSVLKRFNKRITPEQNQEAINFLKEIGIHPHIYIIMFEALETIKDLDANFNFIKTNKYVGSLIVSNLYNCMIPFYKTPYWENYGDYYSGEIHGMSKPHFQDQQVKDFYEKLYLFREEFEDRIKWINTRVKAIHKERHIDLSQEILQDYTIVRVFEYIVFETMLNLYKSGQESVDYESLKELPTITSCIQVLSEVEEFLQNIISNEVRNKFMSGVVEL